MVLIVVTLMCFQSSDDSELVHARVSAEGDPGYASTAIMLCESGLCLALDDLTNVNPGPPMSPTTEPLSSPTVSIDVNESDDTATETATSSASPNTEERATSTPVSVASSTATATEAEAETKDDNDSGEWFGCLTPSTAMGYMLIRRLEATGKFTFETVSVKKANKGSSL